MGSNESQNSDNYNLLKETTLTPKDMSEKNLGYYSINSDKKFELDGILRDHRYDDKPVYLESEGKIFEVDIKKVVNIIDTQEKYNEKLGTEYQSVYITLGDEGSNAKDGKLTLDYREVNSDQLGLSDKGKQFIQAHEAAHLSPDRNNIQTYESLNEVNEQAIKTLYFGDSEGAKAYLQQSIQLSKEREFYADTKGAEISTPEGALEFFNKAINVVSKSLTNDLIEVNKAMGVDPNAPNYLSENYGHEMQNYGSEALARMMAKNSRQNSITGKNDEGFSGKRDETHPTLAERIENIERNFDVKLPKSQGFEVPEERKLSNARDIDGKKIDLSDAVGGMQGLHLDTKLSHEDLTSRIGAGIQAPTPVVAPEPPSPSLRPGK